MVQFFHLLMRIVLKECKQKELILFAKGNLSWKELSKLLNCSPTYLSNDLKYEFRYLSHFLYEQLCKMTNKNFDEFIIDKLDDNWGRSKGGKNSTGNTKYFNEPLESIELAELFGIIVGDGHVEKITVGKKVRCYSIDIAGDSRNDKDYLTNYVSSLFKKLFNEKGSLRYSKNSNCLHLKIHGKKIVEFIEKKGILSGNKKNNCQTIPEWIFSDNNYLESFIRGLIDTDGCVYYISKNNRNLRISFTSYISTLISDVRASFIKLGFHPSEIIRNKDIILSRKEEVKRFIDEIGFSNNKHLKRIQKLNNCALVV